MSVDKGAIRLRGVHKSFRAHHAMSLKESLIHVAQRRPLYERREILRGIDLDVAPGERVAIIGRNGAGKSTLFRLVSQILRADRGDVELNGRVSPLIEITAGHVLDMTGAENIRLNALLLGLPRHKLADRFDAIVDFAGIREFLDTPVRYYSSGMHARLGFSVAVNVDADILLIDEVLAVGDAEFQARCLARLDELARKNVTIVFVSHDLSAVRALCPRSVWLDAGKVRQDGATDAVVAAYSAEVVHGTS